MRHDLKTVSFLAFLFLATSVLSAQSVDLNLRQTSTQESLEGQWVYRSFRSVAELPEEPVPVRELLFGRAWLNLALDSDRVTGSIGGNDWELEIYGKVTGDDPQRIEFRAEGTVGESAEEWVYDYVGYVVPAWENGVDQVPAIVGTVVRTRRHGDRPAGVVAQWIAVRAEAGEPVFTSSEPPLHLESRPSVLFFVQGASCPHCMTQLTGMASALAADDLDVSVISASSSEDLEGFPDVPFRLIADPDRRLFRQHNVMDGEAVLHATIVRNADGRTTFEDIGEEPFMDESVIRAAAFGPVRQEPEIVIAVRNTVASDDDYVTWAPCECEVYIENGDPGGDDIEVFITNEWAEDEPAGGLAFAETVAPGNTATGASVQLTLSQNGNRETFFIAGVKASELTEQSLIDDGRDALIEVRAGDENGAVLSSRKVMVRVRRDASNLNSLERREFLRAIETFKASGVYDNMVAMHTVSTGRMPGSTWPDQAHDGPGFLPWHRAFLLQYERSLQATHPHVALHFWREDLQSQVFISEYFGSTSTLGGLELVNFGQQGDNNPLFGWQFNGVALRRRATDRTNLSWCREQSLVTTPSGYREFHDQLETNPHDLGHGWVGGPMADCRTSPRDPLFFIFHCDVDRLWAAWQYRHNRFRTDGVDDDHYEPNDAYSPGSVIAFGHHLEDTMWPWDQIQGPGNAGDPFDDRPDSAPMSPFPLSTMPGIWPEAVADTDPRVSDMIDYMTVGGGSIDLGFCYEDIPFGANASPPPPVVVSGIAEAVDQIANERAAFATRERVASQLAGPLDDSQIEKLLGVLVDTSQPDTIRRSTMGALSSQESTRWVEAAIEIAGDESAATEDLRISAVEQLGRAAMFTTRVDEKKGRIQEAISGLVDVSQPLPLRIVALEVLSTAQNENAIETLRETAAGEQEIVPVVQAVAMLATAQPGGNFDVLRPLIDRSNPDEVRIEALLSIGADSESLAGRRQILADRSETTAVRIAAAQSLMHRDPEFVESAVSLLNDAGLDGHLQQVLLQGIRVHAVNRPLNRSNPSTILERIELLETGNPALADRIEQLKSRVRELQNR